MNCCLNDLGLKPHNEDVDTSVVASQTGVYQALIEFNGTIQRISFEGAASAKLIIPRPFNENFIYKFTMIAPDGSQVTKDACPNFQFKTYVNINTSCNGMDYECAYY